MLREVVSKENSRVAVPSAPLINQVDSSSANPPTNPTGNLWLDEGKVNKVKSLLVVAKDANVEGKALEKTVIENGIQVQKQYVNNNGDTVIIFPDETSRNNLKEKLTSTGITSNLMKEPKGRYPVISVVGIPKEFDKNNKDDIYKTLLSQNPYITDCLKNESSTFEILSVKPLRANENIKQAIVRLSDDIRHVIKRNNDKIYFGLLSCSVYDQLYIKRCHKCQGFGHYAKDCSHSTCCGTCASNDHETLNCIHKDSPNVTSFHSCTNCIKAGKTGDDTKHPAYSNECSAYRTKQEKLKASLSYYSKN